VVVAPWAMAMTWASRLGVRILPTHHWMDGVAVRLVRRSTPRGIEYTLLVADDLGPEWADWALLALSRLDPEGWHKAMSQTRRMGRWRA
jgi:hypothetical protein